MQRRVTNAPLRPDVSADAAAHGEPDDRAGARAHLCAHGCPHAVAERGAHLQTFVHAYVGPERAAERAAVVEADVCTDVKTNDASLRQADSVERAPLNIVCLVSPPLPPPPAPPLTARPPALPAVTLAVYNVPRSGVGRGRNNARTKQHKHRLTPNNQPATTPAPPHRRGRSPQSAAAGPGGPRQSRRAPGGTSGSRARRRSATRPRS